MGYFLVGVSKSGKFRVWPLPGKLSRWDKGRREAVVFHFGLGDERRTLKEPGVYKVEDTTDEDHEGDYYHYIEECIKVR